MLTLLFFILMFVIFGNLVRIAFRLAWGIMKVVAVLIIVPVVLIVLTVVGMVYIALPVLAVIGVCELIESV